MSFVEEEKKNGDDREDLANFGTDADDLDFIPNQHSKISYAAKKTKKMAKDNTKPQKKVGFLHKKSPKLLAGWQSRFVIIDDR